MQEEIQKVNETNEENKEIIFQSIFTIFESKATYDGDKNEEGKKQGYGIIEYVNGDKYEGQFHDDQIQGKGNYTYFNKSVYEGEFVGGKKQGYGFEKYINGDYYQGYFEQNKKEGNGVFS